MSDHVPVQMVDAEGNPRINPDGTPMMAPVEPVVEDEPDHPAAPMTHVEETVAAAHADAASHEEFVAALKERGLKLARVAAPDLVHRALREHEEHEAVAADPTYRPRVMAPLAVGEVVAVDNLGDVHPLDPSRPDAAMIERHASGDAGLPTVSGAHAEWGAVHKVTAAQQQRITLRDKLWNIADRVAGAGRSDLHVVADAVVELARASHAVSIASHPADHLRAAVAALASGHTAFVRVHLHATRAAVVMDTPQNPDGTLAHNPAIEAIDASLFALNEGDRAGCMEHTTAAIPLVENWRHADPVKKPAPE